MAKYTYTDENGNKTIIKLTDCRVSNEENRVYGTCENYAYYYSMTNKAVT